MFFRKLHIEEHEIIEEESETQLDLDKEHEELKRCFTPWILLAKGR